MNVTNRVIKIFELSNEPREFIILHAIILMIYSQRDNCFTHKKNSFSFKF